MKAMILAGEGINCENETALAFKEAGFSPEIIYIQEWKQRPELIFGYKVLALPGGFSFGDEINSGQILALDLKYSVGKEINEFIKRKGLVIGICNGFQILMKLGIFETDPQNRKVTLFHNESFKFQDRWVQCEVPASKCVWTKGMQKINLPIRHGEGRIIFSGTSEEQTKTYQEFKDNSQIALTYSEDVNGSFAKIAGLTDKTGQVLGLMPHPEAALHPALYPTALKQDPALVSKLFLNARTFIQENL